MSNLKRLVNHREQDALEELENVGGEYGHRINIKVRMADVLPIENSGISHDLYTFALKSHFDFLACNDDHRPLFAVEFDGPSHQTDAQRERDSKKDALCERFDVPLLRINANHLPRKYHKASLLKWIISAWELQKSFYDAQEKGQVSEDEDFDPIFLWHPGTTVEEIHPHWIALKPRLHMEKLHKEGLLPHGHTCGFTFYDHNDNRRGIEWIDVANGQVVFVESGMRAQRFPISMSDLFSELMTILLYDKLMAFLKSGVGSVEPCEVEARFNELQKSYRFACSHSGPTLVRASIPLKDVWA